MSAPPDWVTIRIILTAIETGSVTRAADRCSIATSAAAKRIQTLELDLGTALLERGARGVRPTPAGEVFAHHARALLDIVARLSGDLAALASGGLGSARLHATATLLAGSDLAEALASFNVARPGIAVELREATSLAIIQDLVDGRADLGLITTAAQLPPGLTAQLWRQDRLLLVVRQDDPRAARVAIAFSDALEQPLICVLESGAITLLLEQAAQALGRRPRYKFRVESTEASRRLVAAGHGATVMPDGVLRGHEAAFGLHGIPLSDDWACRQLRLVWRGSGILSAPARLLRDHLLGASADAPSVGRGR